MKRICKAVCAGVCASLLLTGCSSLMNTEYISVEDHNESVVTEADNSALRVENYQELVTAILYYVAQASDTGIIHLYNYQDNVEDDLEKACLEVVQEDPLGSYAVDYIKYQVNHIVSYYEATIQVSYRRTPEQILSVESVTGSSAIRNELAEAFETYQQECVLQISYFDENTVDVQQLAQEAYLMVSESSFEMPQISFTCYPKESTSRHRILEVFIDYDATVEELQSRTDEVEKSVDEILTQLEGMSGEDAAGKVLEIVRDLCDVSDTGDSVYDAAVSHKASGMGLALLTKLLYEKLGFTASVTKGEYQNRDCYWVECSWGSGDWIAVPERDTDNLFQAEQMEQYGYQR